MWQKRGDTSISGRYTVTTVISFRAVVSYTIKAQFAYFHYSADGKLSLIASGISPGLMWHLPHYMYKDSVGRFWLPTIPPGYISVVGLLTCLSTYITWKQLWHHLWTCNRTSSVFTMVQVRACVYNVMFTARNSPIADANTKATQITNAYSDH